MKTKDITLSESAINAIIQNHGTYMIDHLSEWNGGYNPNISDLPNLPCGRSQVGSPQDMVEQIRTQQAPASSERKTCNCNIKNLVDYGCKCGGY